MGWWYVPQILQTSLILMGWAMLMNNLGGRRYPSEFYFLTTRSFCASEWWLTSLDGRRRMVLEEQVDHYLILYSERPRSYFVVNQYPLAAGGAWTVLSHPQRDTRRMAVINREYLHCANLGLRSATSELLLLAHLLDPRRHLLDDVRLVKRFLRRFTYMSTLSRQ
jgi:hypothetical protein